MPRSLITGPTVEFVPLVEAKAHLRVDHTDDDALIGSLVSTAATLAGLWIGKVLRPQLWELRLTAFPTCRSIVLGSPLISVDSIIYNDGEGEEQTVAEQDYRLFRDNIHTEGVEPAFGVVWPAARQDRDAVRIRYQVGYPAAEGEIADALPPPIRAAILLMVGDLYAFRETASAEATPSIDMTPTVTALLSPYRQIFV